jgi:hypothetical protein
VAGQSCDIHQQETHRLWSLVADRAGSLDVREAITEDRRYEDDRY